MPRAPAKLNVRQHPGSTQEEIEAEPDWSQLVGRGSHRTGFRNYHDWRVAGHTHYDEEWSEQDKKHARKLYDELADKEKKGELVNWRDVMSHVTDFHLRTNANRSIGWRFVLPVTEDFVRNEQKWPLNLKRKQQQDEKDDGKDDNKKRDDQDQDQGDQQKEKQEDPRDKYSSAELALLKALESERDYIANLENDDGKGFSPQKRNRTQISIAEDDQFTPDNWLPRAPTLIRLTGKHPMNAEPDLSTLFDAGIVTPNELHYVRNHGPVPHLIWELHKIDFQNGKAQLSMDSLKNDFDPINIPIALACDGNRRKEYNMVKSTAFGWAAGGVSCAFWKGALLRDVLLAMIPDDVKASTSLSKRWVNFAGADKPSEGTYETCIPLEYAMDPTNDVLLAYGMNCHDGPDGDVPLPPDHGYPVRLMIPGCSFLHPSFEMCD